MLLPEGVGDRRQGWAFLSVTGIMLVAAMGAIYWAETYGNPILTALGVDPSRITTISYGKERPAALGSDEQAWAQNRRAVTVTIGGMGQ